MMPMIQQVQIRNYKSIGGAVVDLEPFTAIVGPNGAGKSNFIDALAFVQECLSDSIELAFKKRGGISAVRRRSGGHPTNIGVRVALILADGLFADYAFEIAARPKEKFRVARERCIVTRVLGEEHSFEIRNGAFVKEIPGIRPRVEPDRLALFVASATPEFRPVYDFLTSMRCYSILPERLRELQEPDAGDYLKSNGSNAAAILKRLKEEGRDDQYGRLCRLLSRVVEGVKGVEYKSIGQKETLKFKQDVGLKYPWTFDALNMSDGTLRVLGLLLAVYQPNASRVVAIEEPEATVHPAAAEIIVEVLLDASRDRQILVTTHSPDILDYKELADSQIRVASNEQGETIIAPLSGAAKELIRKRLCLPGDLLRSDELRADFEAARGAAQHLNLFGQAHFGEAPAA